MKHKGQLSSGSGGGEVTSGLPKSQQSYKKRKGFDILTFTTVELFEIIAHVNAFTKTENVSSAKVSLPNKKRSRAQNELVPSLPFKTRPNSWRL